jgi:3-deoxy-D-manno-octulosonate 8-phosphate phosphatase (KDO 8-P phosphatase)
MTEDRFEEHLELFRAVGGEFWTPAAELREKILRIRGIIFDWDGVFHIGQKGKGQCGVFSEADSMGTNMIRYCYWRKYHELPFMAIISGEKDETASTFAEREHFHVVYTGIADKKDALDHACAAAGIGPLQVACVFDDINDLSMVEHCGLKIQVRRAASPLFMEYTKQQGLCDYITGHPAQAHAVREFCELFLGLCGNYQEIIASRTAFDSNYQAYWKARNEIKTNYYSKSNLRIQ